MQIRNLSLTLLLWLALGASQAAEAHSPDHHDHQEPSHDHSQEAHVHGIGELLIGQEGEQLDIELISPAINLVGFEHTAVNAEQRAGVKDAEKRLAASDLLFQFESADCRLSAHSADFSQVLGDEEDGHHKGEHRGHSDIRARYRYQCARPDRLQQMSVNLSRHFPGLQKVQVQWIVNDRQGATVLDNGHTLVVFR